MGPTIQRRISISATNRLGRRIRHEGLSTADQAHLESVLLDAFDALTTVSNTLHSELAGVAFTQRLKTVGTIVDKLQRERRMALSKMRDLAGIRIVEEMNRVEQDELVRRVAAAVGGAHVVDRRTRPSHGYRAVHLEVDCSGTFVEIQVRTALQDQWAQVVERLGDSWGRQIRYGGGPPKPDHEIGPDFPRSELWDLVQMLSEQIDIVERSEVGSVTPGLPPGEPDLAAIWAGNQTDLTDILRKIELIAVSGAI